MDLLKYVVGGLIGAAIGAVVWAAIAHFANFELGWIAWGIGILAGIGVRITADNEASDLGGIVAVLCAVIGLSAGKYAAVYMDVNEFTSELSFDSDPEHAARVAIADEIVESWSEQGHQIEWPRGAAPYESWTEADFPSDIWDSASSKWDNMNEMDRVAYCDEWGIDRGEPDEHIISYIADDYVWEAEDVGRELNWPRGTAPYDAWEQSDYPTEIWDAMVAMWDGMPESERKDRIAEADINFAGFTTGLTNDLFTSSFTLWDFLWFGLALASAWSLAARDELT